MYTPRQLRKKLLAHVEKYPTKAPGFPLRRICSNMEALQALLGVSQVDFVQDYVNNGLVKALGPGCVVNVVDSDARGIMDSIADYTDKLPSLFACLDSKL